MKTDTQRKKPKEVWLVRCSQGHEFYTDYLPEIVNKETGDFECSKCVAEKKVAKNTPGHEVTGRDGGRRVIKK